MPARIGERADDSANSRLRAEVCAAIRPRRASFTSEMRLEHKVALNTVLFLAVLVGAGVLSTAMRRVDSLAGGQTLIVPVLGVRAEQLVDSWGAPRGRKRVHKGIDIMAREGTPVRAAMAGTIAKLFRSKHGGVTVYQFDPGGRLVLYYAHLKGYAWSLREGDKIAQGQMIGTVGRTGNATTPHLHFEICTRTTRGNGGAVGRSIRIGS